MAETIKIKNLDDLRNLQPGYAASLIVNTGRITRDELNKALYKLKSFWYNGLVSDPIPVRAILCNKDGGKYSFTSKTYVCTVNESDIYVVDGKIGFHLDRSNISPKPKREQKFKLNNLSDGEKTNITLDTFLEYFA
ncbi:MAG: hypothetical protein AABW51_04525 [Nanoarchaeota archaeon]